MCSPIQLNDLSYCQVKKSQVTIAFNVKGSSMRVIILTPLRDFFIGRSEIQIRLHRGRLTAQIHAVCM